MKTMKTTLNTPLHFEVQDYRNQNGFPGGPEGLLYTYREEREVRCRLTGVPVRRKGEYLLRFEISRGWRVDIVRSIGPCEAFYGEDGTAYWPSPEDAAKALASSLEAATLNTTLTSWR